MSGHKGEQFDKLRYENTDLEEQVEFFVYSSQGAAFANVSVTHSGKDSYAVIGVPMDFLLKVIQTGAEVVSRDHKAFVEKFNEAKKPQVIII